MKTVKSLNLNNLLKHKPLLIFVIVMLALLWAFDRYVVMPICMPFSKPVTMYMEWSEKQRAMGTPKRINFRIPAAYLIPINSPDSRGAGYHQSVGFNFNLKNDGPACLMDQGEPYEREKNKGQKIIVNMKPGVPDGKTLQPFLTSCTRHPKIVSDMPGFNAYQSSSQSICYVPHDQTTPVYIDCLKMDKPRGCMATSSYKNMRVHYIMRVQQLPAWQDIQTKVFQKIDGFTASIAH